MASPEAVRYDVLIVGAGGAGLRAAIEAAQAGVSVGLICKSLLGKAHTVMAEGGMAAALANVDDRDSWRVHFADTMRGGQYLNNWRMAELHAQEAPDRIRELEGLRDALGRLLRRMPSELRGDADFRLLEAVAEVQRHITLVHLINRRRAYSSSAKDYEFSRGTVRELWEAGLEDVRNTCAHPDWSAATEVSPGIRVFDPGSAGPQ